MSDRNVAELTGYLHPGYAASLVEWGSPQELTRSGGWILVRSIPGTPWYDAMGCYPLFACQDWNCLGADLESLQDEIVSVTLVTDPFGDFSVDDLHLTFPDLCVPYKQHLVVDLSRPLADIVSSHHRRNLRKSEDLVRVERCRRPSDYLDEWTDLYVHLIAVRSIRGLQAFSRCSFARQLQVPGLVMFRALSGAETVGMLLWYVHRNIGYYHLGAYSDAGYGLGASFALFWASLNYFAGQGLRWLSLGAGAGAKGDEADGLTRFKKGWATGDRTAYLCGCVLSRERYDALLEASQPIDDAYFPPYRAGEFS